MNSQERLAHSRELADLFGQDHISRMVAERENRDPSVAVLRQRYLEQAQAITLRLENADLSPRKRHRLEWHLSVLNYRAEQGPRVHEGYYDFNFLPKHISDANPQLKRPKIGVLT